VLSSSILLGEQFENDNKGQGRWQPGMALSG